MKYWPWYVALGLVTFILVAGGVIGSRLSEQTLAFMAGVIFGGIAALPIGAVVGWAVKSQRHADRAYTQTQPAVIMTPPVFQGITGAAAYPASQQVVSAAPSARREFTTIGEEEIVYHESEPVW
jgi:MFS family permease